MSSDNNDDYPEWFKKRRSQSKDPFFGDIIILNGSKNAAVNRKTRFSVI